MCKQLYPGLPLKITLQTTIYAFQEFYIISDQQYVIHIYLSEMLYVIQLEGFVNPERR